MRHNIVTAQTSGGRAVAVLVERVPGRLLEDARPREDLSGRLAGVIADLLQREAQDRLLAGRGGDRDRRRAQAKPTKDVRA